MPTKRGEGAWQEMMLVLLLSVAASLPSLPTKPADRGNGSARTCPAAAAARETGQPMQLPPELPQPLPRPPSPP